MSKTFKSVTGKSDSRRVHIESRPEGPNIWISDNSWGSDYGITLAPSDVAELMLAIGDTLPVPDMVREGSYEHFLSSAIHCLAKAVKAQESEAEAQAKLEAEALEFLNVTQKHNGIPLTESWDGFKDGGVKILYMNMARKARELSKETEK